MNNFNSYIKQSITDYFNIQPCEVKGLANGSTAYYKRILYNKLYSVYNFNIPDDKMLGWLRFFLFHFGSIAYIKSDELGWIFYPYSAVNFNYIYRPQEIECVIINSMESNEVIKGVVGQNCEVVNIFDDFFGCDDIITRYAEMLAQCDKSVNINLMNANVGMCAYVDNKKDADVLKEAYGKATTGEPFIVLNKELLMDENGVFKPLFNDVKSMFIGNDIMALRRSILNAFLTEIGIRNSNYDKRERLTTDEIGENNDETRSIVEIIYNNISDCFKRCSTISGEQLTVELTYDYETNNDIINEETGVE